MKLIQAAARSTVERRTKEAKEVEVRLGNNDNLRISDEESDIRSDKCDSAEDSESGYEDDNDEILNATTRLKDFFFLLLRNIEQRQRSYTMHKLVQDSTRYGVNRGNRAERQVSFSKAALDILSQVSPESNYQTWKRCESFLPHAIRVSDWPELNKEKVSILNL